MKIFSVLFALFAVSEATSTFGLNKALSVRGGGEIGPIDGAMAMKISKTVATAYVAGSATKYIASNTGGGSTLIGDKVTSDSVQRYAMMTAIACGMYGLIDTGFDDLKTLASLAIISLGLRLQDAGVSADTIKDNWIEAAVAAGLAFIAFVN